MKTASHGILISIENQVKFISLRLMKKQKPHFQASWRPLCSVYARSGEKSIHERKEEERKKVYTLKHADIRRRYQLHSPYEDWILKISMPQIITNSFD